MCCREELLWEASQAEAVALLKTWGRKMFGALFKWGRIREPGSTGFLKLSGRQRPEAWDLTGSGTWCWVIGKPGKGLSFCSRCSARWLHPQNREWEPILCGSASKFFGSVKNVRLSRVYSKVSDRLIIVFKQENDILISDYQRYLPFLLPKKDFVNVKF